MHALLFCQIHDLMLVKKKDRVRVSNIFNHCQVFILYFGFMKSTCSLLFSYSFDMKMCF